MLEVSICHAPADHDIALQIAARLERGAEARVSLEACGPQTSRSLTDGWEGGLSSTAILLLLSPDAVPPKLNRKEWEPILLHLEQESAPPMGTVLLKPCPHPRLLDRTRLFAWEEGPNEALRQMERWVLSLHPEPGARTFRPARLEWFGNRDCELQVLWQHLVDASSTVVLSNAEPRSGKSCLAQEFARCASAHFRDVIWIPCGHRSPASIAGELAEYPGLADRRVLVILDDFQGGDLPLDPGRASLLLTTRSEDLALPSYAREIHIPTADGPAPLLPKEGVWEVISVCRPQGFSLEFAARIAGYRLPAAELIRQRLVDPLDEDGACFRLGAARAAEVGERVRRKHAEVLDETFARWRSEPEGCRRLLGEMESAMRWALQADWALAIRLGQRACAYLRSQQRPSEAAVVYTWLLDGARERADAAVMESCTWELSWIHDHMGEVRRPIAATDQLGFDFAGG